MPPTSVATRIVLLAMVRLSLGVQLVEKQADGARQFQRLGRLDPLAGVEARLVQAVDRAEHLAADDDRHVDDGLAAERLDQLVVGENRRDAVDVVGDEGPLLDDDLTRPVGLVGGLGSGDRIGIRHVGIDPLEHAVGAVMRS